MSLLTVDRLVVVVINGGIDVAFITQEIYCTPASVCVCVWRVRQYAIIALTILALQTYIGERRKKTTTTTKKTTTSGHNRGVENARIWCILCPQLQYHHNNTLPLSRHHHIRT